MCSSDLHVKDLGVDDTLAGARRVEGQRERVQSGVDAASRVARVPLGWGCRARLVASLVKGQTQWGLDITGMAPQRAGRLRHAMVQAVTGGQAARRAPEVVLAMAAPNAFIEPAPHQTWTVIMNWSKRLTLDPGLAQWIGPAWESAKAFFRPKTRLKGPVDLLVRTVQDLGWEPRTPASWVTPEGPIEAASGERLGHVLAETIRQRRWESLAERRREFKGAEDGVDEAATFRGPLAALARKATAAFARAVCIISGGTWTRSRCARAGYVGESDCPYCPGVTETPIHRWWQCPRWDLQRGLDGAAAAERGRRASWEPACLWECGILPRPVPADCPPPPPRPGERGDTDHVLPGRVGPRLHRRVGC